MALVRSVDVLFGDLFAEDQFFALGGLVYVRFQSTLDILLVTLLVAPVVGQLVGFLLGVRPGLL